MNPYIEWNELARKICKRNEENKINNAMVLDEIDEDEDDEEYEDEEDEDEDYYEDNNEIGVVTKPTIESTKKPSTQKPSEIVPSSEKPAPTTSTSTSKPAVVDSKQNDIIEDGDYEYDDENEEDDDDSDEDIEDERTDIRINSEKDKKVLLDGVNIIQEIEKRMYGKLKSLMLPIKCYILVIFKYSFKGPFKILPKLKITLPKNFRYSQSFLSRTIEISVGSLF